MHSFNYLANWVSKCCVAFVLALALTACGYSLRGSEQATTTLSKIILTASNPNDPLVAELIGALDALSVDVVVNSDVPRDGASITLRLGDERLDRRAVSVNSRARAAQYELSLHSQLTLTVGSAVLLDAVEVSVQSEYFEEIENLAGTQDEIALLTQEMRRSLVLQIIRRASAAIQ